MTEEQIQELVRKVAQNFRCFGGGIVRNPSNPLSHALKDVPPAFAAGVPIEDVVRFIVQKQAGSNE